jgi:hypothetical protein
LEEELGIGGGMRKSGLGITRLRGAITVSITCEAETWRSNSLLLLVKKPAKTVVDSEFALVAAELARIYLLQTNRCSVYHESTLDAAPGMSNARGCYCEMLFVIGGLDNFDLRKLQTCADSPLLA